jgi:hypothetical protein
MTTASVARYQQKATALAQAWANVLGSSIDPHSLITAMAIAELETNLGDWGGSHNWGGIYKRVLTSAEQAKLTAAGVTPSSPNALTSARALLPAGANEILRIDTAPVTGAYFVWSWAWPDDVAGATQFVQVLVKNRPTVAAVLPTGTATDVATAMYNTHYFEGNSTDPQTNINAYAASITKHANAISAALGGWLPPATPPTAPSSPQGAPTAPQTPVAKAKAKGGSFGLGLVAAVVAVVVFSQRQRRLAA